MPANDRIDNTSGLVSRDEKFLSSLNEVIHDNIGNELFGVNELAGAMAMSRVHLYRKIHRLTGKNISQFIRERRLQFARELLLKDVATVAEIAYRAGFTSPAYFSKCFHEFYGYPPGEVKKRNGPGNLENPTVEEPPANPVSSPASRRNRTLRMVMIISGLILISVILILLDYFYRGSRTIAGNTVKTIAIPPFRNNSPDSANQYFCNGIQEAIQHQLIKVGGLRVFALDPSNFSGVNKDPQTLAAEMGVDHLLYGSVGKSDEEFQIAIQLINGSNGEILWAEIYREPLTGKLFEVQQNITSSVVKSLGIKTTPDEKRLIEKDPMTDPEAYDYVLMARDLSNQFWRSHDEDYVKSIHFFADKALAIDPESPLVNQAKGDAYLAEIYFKLIRGTTYPDILRSQNSDNPLVNIYDSAHFYANRALQADPESAMAYNLKGGIYYFQLELDKSIENNLKALEIMPNDPQLNGTVGVALVSKKDNREYLIKGLTCLRKSVEWRPKNDPAYYFKAGDLYFNLGEYNLAEKNYLESYRRGYSCPGWLMYCHVLNYQGKFRESAAFVDSVCVVQGEVCNVHCANTKIYSAIGLDEYEKAERLLEDKYRQGIRNLPGLDSLIFAHIYMNTGRQEEGKNILSAMMNNIDRKAMKIGYQEFYYDLVLIYSLLNEKQTALQYLDSLTSHVVLMNERDFIINFPYCRNIREEPRFKIYMDRARKKNEEVMAAVLGNGKLMP